MDRMTRHRRRLQMLIVEAGNQPRLAELIGSAQSYISQLLNTRPGIHRKFLERLEQCMDKPDGWMDQWLPDETRETIVDRRITPIEGQLLAAFRLLDEPQRTRLMGWIETETQTRLPANTAVPTRPKRCQNHS